jgi:hypothetical protein
VMCIHIKDIGGVILKDFHRRTYCIWIQ